MNKKGSGPPQLNQDESSDPNPAPANDEGEALGPPGASTTALSDSVEEGTDLDDLDVGWALPLSTGIQNGFSNEDSSPDTRMADAAQGGDPGADSPRSSGPLSPYVGGDVDAYTNRPADPDANSVGQNIHSLDDLWNAMTLDEHAQWLASIAPVSTADPNAPVSGPSPTASGTGSSPGSSGPDAPPPTVTIDGKEYSQPIQVVMNNGLTYNEYVATDGSGIYSIAASPPTSSQAVTPAAPNAPSTAIAPTTSPASASDASQGRQPGAGGPPPGSQSGGSNNPPYDPMADRPFARWLLYRSHTPTLDALTSDANLHTAQNVALGIGVGAGLAAGALAVAPAVGTAYAEAGIQAAARFPTATSIATGIGNAISGTTVPRAVAGAAGLAGAKLASDELGALAPQIENELPALAKNVEEELPAVARNIANEIPTGPSFKGVIDPEEFSNAPKIIDRLSRARQFDIGTYKDLTAAGRYGRKFDGLDSDEALQNAYLRLTQGVNRVSPLTNNNPAMALTRGLHSTIQNMKTPQMQALSPNQVLQAHLAQMKEFVPDFALRTLEQEAENFIKGVFGVP